MTCKKNLDNTSLMHPIMSLSTFPPKPSSQVPLIGSNSSLEIVHLLESTSSVQVRPAKQHTTLPLDPSSQLQRQSSPSSIPPCYKIRAIHPSHFHFAASTLQGSFCNQTHYREHMPLCGLTCNNRRTLRKAKHMQPFKFRARQHLRNSPPTCSSESKKTA